MLLGALTLGILWAVLWWHLSNEWSANEQYSYGWFVPFFALFLFWLRWEDKPDCGMRVAEGGTPEARRSEHQDRPEPNRGERSSKRKMQTAIASERGHNNDVLQSAFRDPRSTLLLLTSAFLLLLLLPIRLFEVGNPDWRPLGWLHALIVLSITATVIWRIGGVACLKHFAFPLGFTLVAVPWISGVETPIINGLMAAVATVAAETLNLLGVPAQLEGSLIRVSTGLVGVNEACSGVRSLQTSIMIGLLFGELKRLSVARRLALLGGALAIAIAANFGRAFVLVWLSATQNPDVANQWHDGLGYSIVGVVFVGSMALAGWLGKRGEGGKPKGEKLEIKDRTPAVTDLRRAPSMRIDSIAPAHERSGPGSRRTLPSGSVPASAFAIAFVWLLFIEIGVETWYRAHERNLVPQATWAVNWPKAAPAFREIEIDETVARTLRFDEGQHMVWTLGGKPGPLDAAKCFSFFFRWAPGNSTILRARSHRPDICLPSVGWRQVADHGVRDYPVAGGASLPFRQFTFEQTGGPRRVVAHAFFCLTEDKVKPAPEQRFDVGRVGASEWMRSDRLRVVLQGLRNPGQQMLQIVLVSSTEMSSEDAAQRLEQLLREVVVVRPPESA